MDVNKLTITEKFGQMIMLGLDTYDINDEIIKLIQEYKIGGIVLYKKNYTSLENMIEVINKLKSINKDNKIPLFIAIDQENGRVNRLPKEVNRLYNARKQAKCNDKKIIDVVNSITTNILSKVGVNMNLAPVLDIDKDITNKTIGDRSYGDTLELVNKFGIRFMKCMQEKNVLPVVKHFPGHGATNKDSHRGVPSIKDIDKLLNNDIKTFEYAINNGCDAIMIGHLRLKGFGTKPASINQKIIKELLIDKYNYKNLIMTDDLRMGFLCLKYGTKKLIKYSINAGNDIIMIKYKKGDINKFYKKLYKEVNNYELDFNRIEESANKIINMKNKYKMTNNMIKTKIDVEDINNKIDNINKIMDKIVI